MISPVEVFFLIAAGIAVTSAVLTISAHNIIHALLYLVTMMLSVALLFFLLGASFAAALQVIIYAGAIMVLFVFVTMMLHQGEHTIQQEKHLFQYAHTRGPLILSLLLAIELIAIVYTSSLPEPHLGTTHAASVATTLSAKELALQLFGPYKLLVVLAALMLLSALISAIHITRHSTSTIEPDNQKNSPNKTSKRL